MMCIQHVCLYVPEYDECLSDPCQNNGTCSDRFESYVCSCTPGYGGPDCEIGDLI